MIKKLLFTLFIFQFFTIPADAQCWSQVAPGWFHNVAIQTDGTLWAWGRNDFGQLGDGTNTNRLTPVQIGTDNDWIFVDSGDHHTIALKANGTLWSWGLNNSGQLGDGTFVNRNYPAQIGTDTDWQTVSLGTKFTLALKNEGELWVWGENGLHQIGGNIPDTENPVRLGTDSDWSEIAAGNSQSLALKDDGTLWGWGSHIVGGLANGMHTGSTVIPTQSGTDNDWQSISTQNHTTLALKTNGTLWSWGSNESGGVGNGASVIHKSTPVPLTALDNPMYMSMGRRHARVIKSDGTLWSWGYNNFGQVGNGTTGHLYVPVQVGIGINWLSANGGEEHTVAISQDHSLYTWGANVYGQLGDGTTTNGLSVTAVGTPCTLAAPTPVKKALRLYPNPAESRFNIDCSSFDSIQVTVSIINSVGQLVQKFDARPERSVLKISVVDYPPGLYIVSINAAGLLFYEKVVVK